MASSRRPHSAALNQEAAISRAFGWLVSPPPATLYQINIKCQRNQLDPSGRAGGCKTRGWARVLGQEAVFQPTQLRHQWICCRHCPDTARRHSLEKLNVSRFAPIVLCSLEKEKMRRASGVWMESRHPAAGQDWRMPSCSTPCMCGVPSIEMICKAALQ